MNAPNRHPPGTSETGDAPKPDSAPRDPLAFDFGINFKTVPERLVGERDRRLVEAEHTLPYCHAFLDDYLRCVMPHDLILLGALTGAGKTEMARGIAASNAAAGRHVFYFALEAEPDEIERRNKFSVLAGLVARRRVDIPGGFNYADWRCGRLEMYLREIDDEADEIIGKRYATLHTYYRDSKFDHQTIRRLFLAIKDQADLIVLDHLHYVDIEDDNENRGFKMTVKMIRDVSLGIGKPVLLIAHLRKRDMSRKSLVPTVEDFHGSSDITKICTRAVLLAPAPKLAIEEMPRRHGAAGTFFSIPKDRISGACNLIALCDFDWRTKTYDANYTLGRQSKSGDKFEPIGLDEVPSWARRHVPYMPEPRPTWQDGEA